MSRRILPSVFQQLYVGDDEVIPYLQQFSERVHKYGAAIMCQITHLARRGEPPGALAAHHRPVRHSRNVTSKFSERNGRSRYRPRGQGTAPRRDDARKAAAVYDALRLCHVM